MNKIKSTFLLAAFIAITATSAFAGDILIMGKNAPEADRTPTATIVIATEPKNKIPFEISDYLWTFANIIRQFKF